MVGIAMDESPELIEPHLDGISFPILLDRDHLLAEVLAISNVPTVIWADEENRIVRPNAVEMGSDVFAEFAGFTSGPHKDLVRAWARTGEVPITPEEAARAVEDLSEEEVMARLHFRLALHAHRDGVDDVAERHFDCALELAPLDFTIARAALPRRGDDPFGEKFFELFGRWQEAGSPYHGIARAD